MRTSPVITFKIYINYYIHMGCFNSTHAPPIGYSPEEHIIALLRVMNARQYSEWTLGEYILSRNGVAIDTLKDVTHRYGYTNHLIGHFIK